MSDVVAEQVKKFVFHSNPAKTGEEPVESLEIFIPEVNEGCYHSI